MNKPRKDPTPHEGGHNPKPKKLDPRPHSNVPEATNSDHAEPGKGKAGPDMPDDPKERD